jgi:iron complex outermembrane receptor protein
MLIDPVQNSHANSWDALLSYRFGEGRLRHTLMIQYKGRRRHVESGGSDFFDFGTVIYGERDPEPRPQTDFGKVTVGRLAQDNYSVGYIGRLDGVGQVNLGVTKTIYRAAVRGPLGTTRSSAKPWLYNASVMIQPLRHLSLYAGYVTGLEDSGIAPENALNRNEQLPASLTRQIDAGIKYDIGRMSLVASIFEISKPYFSFDGVGRYVQIGKVRHRGIEVSASGKLTSRLQILAGAVLMDPVVTGFAVDAGLHGKLPVGTTKLHAKIDANYRTDIFGGLTFTFAMLHDNRRVISSAPYAALGGHQLMLPPQTTFDLGARQTFKIGKAVASARLVIGNIFNQRGWKVLAPNSLQPDETRRYNLYLYVDF